MHAATFDSPRSHGLLFSREQSHEVHFRSRHVPVSVCVGGGCRCPNLVYVLADQWRASATGYAGDPNVKTPNLDRLAKSCLNFRNVVSVAPVCTPYRAALMTGRYPTSTGMFLNDAHLPDNELCMAEIYRAAGYRTGYIGKWHLDGHGRESYIPPERRQGWDYWKAAECDHTYNHSHYYTGESDEKRFWEGYDVFAQTKDAQRYLREQANGERPFLLFVSYGTPHFPHDTAPVEFKALYPPENIQLPPNVPPDMQALAQRRRRVTTHIARRWTGASANYWKRWTKLNSRPTQFLFSLRTTVKCWVRTERVPTSNRWPGTSPRTCRSCCVIPRCTASKGARSARR